MDFFVFQRKRRQYLPFLLCFVFTGALQGWAKPITFPHKSIKRMAGGSTVNIPTGRQDPFTPLISKDPPKPTIIPPKKDILTDIEYVGFINDTGAKGKKIAMLALNDPLTHGTQTLIEQVGAHFNIENQLVGVNEITNTAVVLDVAGQHRTLNLTPFVDFVSEASPPSTKDLHNIEALSKTNPPPSASPNSGSNISSLSNAGMLPNVAIPPTANLSAPNLNVSGN